jgi:hypothetical protein
MPCGKRELAFPNRLVRVAEGLRHEVRVGGEDLFLAQTVATIRTTAAAGM